MAYNSQSPYVQGETSSSMYDWQNAPFPQSAVADPYAGVEYTGDQTYAPDAVDPSEYWNGAGYDQMPEYDANASRTPYDAAANYQPTWIDPSKTDWANVNTYAPWSNPMGPGGVESANQQELMNDPNFWAGGGHTGGTVDNIKRGGIADTYAQSINFGQPLLMMGGSNNLGGLFGSKKKRQNLTYAQPSYQGYMFTPQEGNPNWYNPSAEGQASNQTQASLYTQQPEQSIAGTASYDYDYTGGQSQEQQSYVGQQDQNYGSLYGGSNGQSSLYDTFKPGEFKG